MIKSSRFWSLGGRFDRIRYGFRGCDDMRPVVKFQNSDLFLMKEGGNTNELFVPEVIAEGEGP